MKPVGKRKASRIREDQIESTARNEAWSMGFVMDQLQDRTQFRALTITRYEPDSAVWRPESPRPDAELYGGVQGGTPFSAGCWR